MIENLNGIFETVNFKQSTSLKLYDNDDYESYPPHWHTAVEIIMPLENNYTVDCGGQKKELREWDVLLISPGCIHTITAPPTGHRIIFQPSSTDLRFIKDIDALFTLTSPAIVITPEDYPSIHGRIKDILLEIRDDYFSSSTFSETFIYSKFLEIITLVGRNYIKTNEIVTDTEYKKQEEYIEKFINVCDYINEHCCEDLNLDDIAAMSGFSKFYFSRLFKQFTNVSFYRYVNQKRIAKAESMLVEPQYSVTEVASNCGFSSLSSFIRMFKIVKGCTPSDFRSMYWSHN